MMEYIKTRLNQVDMEIVKPHLFAMGSGDKALQTLHIWRRYIPLYREMVEDILRRIRQFPFSEIESMRGGCIPGASGTGGAEMEWNDVPESIRRYRGDFELVLSQLQEYQERINQLTAVMTAVKSFADNRNLGRLTTLATLFLPFSLISGIFSMEEDIRSISGFTFGLYFAVAAFLVAVVYFVAIAPEVLRLGTIQRLYTPWLVLQKVTDMKILKSLWPSRSRRTSGHPSQGSRV